MDTATFIIVTAYTSAPRLVVAMPMMLVRLAIIAVCAAIYVVLYAAATLIEWLLIAAAALFLPMTRRIEAAALNVAAMHSSRDAAS